MKRTERWPRAVLPSGQLLLAMALFAVFGIANGIWQVLLADVKEALALSEATLGLALTIGGLGGIPFILAGGKLSDRIGPYYVVAAGGLGMCLVFVGFAHVTSYVPLVALLIAYSATAGAYDAGGNTASIVLEQETGEKLLSYIHAAYSAFAALGALAVGLLYEFDLSYRTILLGVAGVVGLFTVVAFLNRTAQRTRAPSTATDGGTKRLQTIRNPAILLVAGIMWIAFLTEGAFSNWSTIYLREALDVPASLGTSGIVVFQTAMAIGRLGGGRLIQAIGQRRVLQIAGLCGALGMAAALATQFLPVVLLGFVLFGFSLSVVFPTGISLAGEYAPTHAGEASSVVSSLGFTAVLIGPVLIGNLASTVSLRLALGVLVVACGLLVVLSAMLPDAGESPESAAPTP
jgi:fucose permease